MVLRVSNTLGGPCHLECARGGTNYAWVYLGASNDSREVPISVEPGDTLRIAWGTYPSVSYPGGQTLTVSNVWTHVHVQRSTQVGPNGSMSVRLVGDTDRAVVAAVQAGVSSKICGAFLGLLVGLAIWASWQRSRR